MRSIISDENNQSSLDQQHSANQNSVTPSRQIVNYGENNLVGRGINNNGSSSKTAEMMQNYYYQMKKGYAT